MAVLLPNTMLGVRRRGDRVVDAYGDFVTTPLGPVEGPWSGAVKEQGDGSWSLRLDPAAWPLGQQDLVVEFDDSGAVTGRTWITTSTQNIEHSLDDTVSYVRVSGLERGAAGTEPGGGEFTGRPVQETPAPSA